MKKTLTFLPLLALTLALVMGSAYAQVPGLKTLKGDLTNPITRTVEQTADSVTFISDTLTFSDNGRGVGNFMVGDSVAIMFVQNRFKVVNNQLSSGVTNFDYIRINVAYSQAKISRQQYLYTASGKPADPAELNKSSVGVRPVYRPVGQIAMTSAFNSDPNAIRQMMTFYFSQLDPREATAGVEDVIQVKNIYFKPNINNLTGLAVPPAITEDTLRAYLLNGSTGPTYGQVVNTGKGWTDLAYVRLLPGTTRYIMWVKDSSQAVDAGEYIGSFGDYSRGRYFLGDDGLPLNANNAKFRPSATRTLGLTVVQNPDYGMMVDGFPPERNPIRLSSLFQILAPPSPSTPNLNPAWGLIPPYRVGPYAAPAANPYQPGLVTSAVDTLRFIDSWGNRTWDRMTQPDLKAIAYTNTTQTEDRTLYLKGYTAADDTLRQFGQIVYRRLAYTAAQNYMNAGGVMDSIRIIASANVKFRNQGGVVEQLAADPDTTGGFPRKFIFSLRSDEAYLDFEPGMAPSYGRTTFDLNSTAMQAAGKALEPYRTPVDPTGVASLPYTGTKITILPNIPRAIEIVSDDTWKSKNLDKEYLNLGMTVYDGYGNRVDDNERYKWELSPFGRLCVGGKNYIQNGVFDSLVTDVPNIVTSGLNLDSGRVNIVASAIARARRVFKPSNPGPMGVGAYRLRVRSSFSFPDHFSDLRYPYKNDPFPTGNPGNNAIFAHMNFIPDGSPNNTFGPLYNPGPTFANFGRPMGQTTAFDSTDVIWQGYSNSDPAKNGWLYTSATTPRIEVVVGTNDALVVGRVGTFTLPGQNENIYSKLYIRLTDGSGVPMDITPYFPDKVKVELPDNQLVTSGAKQFYGSVSPNIALGGYPGPSAPGAIPPPTIPDGLPNAGNVLNAELVSVDASTGFMLPGINGDVPALYPYKAVRFYLRAPRNVRTLSLAGTDKIRLRAYLTVSTVPDACDFSVSSAFAEMSIIPDAVQTVEVFKSAGKPQGALTPMEGWAPNPDPLFLKNELFPTGTPKNATENNLFYQGYFFRARQPQKNETPRVTSESFPSPIEAEAFIGSLLAGPTSLDEDCTAPIPMDTVVVSDHSKQIRLVARLLDRYNNPVGGRLVKFHVESETLPVTPDLDVNGKRIPMRAQDNTQRGGFGNYASSFIYDDTLKRTTVGDTATAGWVTAYFISGRVAHQIVRVALTPDTLAYDLSMIGKNLGEGTIVGQSYRGFAPRVIIPVFQKPDTVVTAQFFPYTAASTSPIPLPGDAVAMAVLEDISLYPDCKVGTPNPAGSPFPCPDKLPDCYRDNPATNYKPAFTAFSANPKFIEQRVTHYGRLPQTNIRPYIPDTLQLTANSLTDPNTITAGRIVTLLVREYDKYGNLIENSTAIDDTARIRFRMWANGKGSMPAPYQNGLADGQFVPAFDWTRDEYGPMRKARYRHTQISNLVSGIHINQTANCIALEFPTPKLVDADMIFEATPTGVLSGLGNGEIARCTTRVVSRVKTPTRFDILRAGQEQLQNAVSYSFFSGTPETRAMVPGADIVLFKTAKTNLPDFEDDSPNNATGFDLTANGLDHLLLSQVYKYNNNGYPVGKYEVVNEHSVPLDKDGDPLYLNVDGDLNPAFDMDPDTKLPVYVKRDAYNNPSLDVLTAGNVPGARAGDLFQVTVAGGGDGIGLNVQTEPKIEFNNNPVSDRRPVLVRITPIWENNPPTGGNPYTVAGKTYENRLFADTIYTYRGTSTVPVDKNKVTRVEFMGTRTDRTERATQNQNDVETAANMTRYDRLTRMNVSNWNRDDFSLTGMPLANLSTARTSTALAWPAANSNYIDGGFWTSSNPNLNKFKGDYNRRYALLPRFLGSGRTPTQGLDIAPGAFLRIVDSTSDQVIDLRVVAPDLTDMAGKVVDDTASYDQGKTLVARKADRLANRYWFLDDTYKSEADGTGIPGPNYNISTVTELLYQKRAVPVDLQGSSVTEYAVTRPAFGPVNATSKLNHTFVVVPYRIAFTTIFPSSFDVATQVYDKTRLPMGILPNQTDIDTIPRVTLTPSSSADLTKFEMFSRLYGQVMHGGTNTLPSNPNQPYARPDTVFTGQTYVYAVTPYDRYGNMNTRDSMFVSIGARFTDWRFLDLEGPDAYLLLRAGGQYFRAIPELAPSSDKQRRDTLRVFNPIIGNIGARNRNDYLGIKPDDKRLYAYVGEAGQGEAILNGLLPANIIASRPVTVEMLFAPAPFTLNSMTFRNTDLFRMDHVGGCKDNGLEKDILHLMWVESKWADPNKNNPNDTIRYEWNALIDSLGVVRRVAVMADEDGAKPMLTIGGDKLRELIYRRPSTYQPNPDSNVVRIKWFVRAFSKSGLETFSDTAGATVRNQPWTPQNPLVISENRMPANPPQPGTPTNNQIILVDANSTIDVQWTPATDVNIDNGNKIGGFKTYDPVTLTWRTELNPSGDPVRTVDSLFYQWVGIVERTYPAGKGAPVGSTVVVNTGLVNGFTIPATVINTLFGGFSTDPTSTSADSVIVKWYVYTKDMTFNQTEEVFFPYNEDGTMRADTGRWSKTSCQPHILPAGPYFVRLTKLDRGGVEIEPNSTSANLQKVAGEEVCFTLTAKDKNGNIIRDWDVKGAPTTLTIKNGTAIIASNDTSMRSWNSDPKGYTWAVISHNGTVLPTTDSVQFTVPASAFVNGVATVCLTYTKADKNVFVEVSPTFTGLNQESVKIDYSSGGITNFLVTITSATNIPNQIYRLRKYEVLAVPRDKFLNPSGDEVRTRWSSRFNAEFDASLPGLFDMFNGGDVYVKYADKYNFFLASTLTRVKPGQLQRIRVDAAANPVVFGESDEFEILDHAPNAFNLLSPADNTRLPLMKSDNREDFTWTNTGDPYTNIKISDITGEIGNDVIHYTTVFVDSISLTRAQKFEANNIGLDNKLTMTHGQLADVINNNQGSTTAKEAHLFWYVEAFDGLYTTLSSPRSASRPGFALWLIKDGILSTDNANVPNEFTLDQNYPNPFNPTTSISYSLPKASQVTVMIYDMLGTPVKSLVNKMQAAGTYTIGWNATNDLGQQVPSGNYIYKIVAGDFTQTRKMTLLK